jgi:hypothetical protein
MLQSFTCTLGNEVVLIFLQKSFSHSGFKTKGIAQGLWKKMKVLEPSLPVPRI